jgi:hypothetical protein
MKNLNSKYEQLSVYLNSQIVETQKKLEEAQLGVVELESGNIQHSSFAVTFEPNIEYWKQQVELLDFRLKWLNIQLSSIKESWLK